MISTLDFFCHCFHQLPISNQIQMTKETQARIIRENVRESLICGVCIWCDADDWRCGPLWKIFPVPPWAASEGSDQGGRVKVWPHPNDRLLPLSPPGLLIIWDFQVSPLESTVSKKELLLFSTKPTSVLIFSSKERHLFRPSPSPPRANRMGTMCPTCRKPLWSSTISMFWLSFSSDAGVAWVEGVEAVAVRRHVQAGFTFRQ